MTKPRTEKPLFHPATLLTIAFIEGAAVMAAELLSAKMLAPFFGTTIYAWAAVLAITLFALAAGYYAGGFFTTRYSSIRILRVILILSGFLLLWMPVVSQWVMSGLMHIALIPGLVISLMTFVFPPVFLFGMVSPVIVHTLVNHVDKTGSTAGKVYAISTMGGVINTLLLGFWIMPQFGIRGPAFVYGVMVLLLPLLLIRGKVKPLPVITILLLAIITLSAQLGEGKSQSQRFSVLYASEGILGQVKVVDIKGLVLNGKPMEPRGLIVNNTWQTLFNRTDQENLLDYVYFIKPMLSKFQGEKGNAMLVGLGGGMLAREMHRTGLTVEVVEIDARLKMLARRYFSLDPEIEVVIDDGRHFINQTEKKYRLVILDAFLGENAPWHLLTKECFSTIQSKLEPDGVLIIEFFGHTKGELGRPARSVLATLRHLGFDVQMVATRKEEAPDRNLIFVASMEEFSFDQLVYGENPYALEPISNLNDYLVTVPEQEMQDALLLHDNLPAMELMLGKPSLQWRNDLNGVLRDLLVEDHLPIFY
jgi:predicted membrane-bound spermidine synthase